MDPVLREKMIHAFLLVDQLAAAELKFTFKGGTSVGLICGRIDRFSIDVDILTSAPRAELETALNSVTHGTRSGITGFHFSSSSPPFGYNRIC
jgi:predicted nucleotidyltransferase component of viral defense system